MKNKYVIYTKMRQGGDLNEHRKQKEKILKFLESTDDGYEIIDEFNETCSGVDLFRPLLVSSISIAKRKKSILIFSSMSRLTRKVLAFCNIKDTGVKMECCSCPKEKDEDENNYNFKMNMAAIMAEHDPEGIMD